MENELKDAFQDISPVRSVGESLLKKRDERAPKINLCMYGKKVWKMRCLADKAVLFAHPVSANADLWF